MNKFIYVLVLVMTSSCSTYSVTCIHNESLNEQLEEIKTDETAKIHSRSDNKSHLIIETKNQKKSQQNY